MEVQAISAFCGRWVALQSVLHGGLTPGRCSCLSVLVQRGGLCPAQWNVSRGIVSSICRSLVGLLIFPDVGVAENLMLWRNCVMLLASTSEICHEISLISKQKSCHWPDIQFGHKVLEK